jgi:hypothetical protein
MASEMVLIPRVRYERLLNADNERGVSNSNDAVENTPKEPESKPHSEANSKAELKADAKAVKESPSKSPGVQSAVKKGKPPGINERKDNISTPQHSTSEGSIKDNKMSVEAIIKLVPSKYKEKAEKVLAHINSKGVSLINWNARGRLIYKGVIINGSSIGELVHGLLAPKKKKSIGFNKFHKALVKINLPVTLLKPYGRVNTASSGSSNGEKENKMKKKWLSY